ncbi:MAG: RIO1 family regulatory kinase/ATPase [Armatimonadota bacterium]
MTEQAQQRGVAFEGLTRDTLARYVVKRLRPGGGTRPALLLIEDRGRRAVVKDYRDSGWLLSRVFGPWLIGREAGIYHRLRGARGVPELIARLDRWALVVEFVEGRAASELPRGSLTLDFFDRLAAVVAGIHARRIVHCDLKNRSNIVVGDDGEPYIVDFASAFTYTGRLGPVRRFLFDRFQLDDRRAVVKARMLVGGIRSEEDERFVRQRSAAERVVRVLRDGVRWVFQFVGRL